MSEQRRHVKALGKGLLGDVPGALKPTSQHDIVAQSRQLVKALYKPVLHQINAEKKQTRSIYEKRQTDNQYYLDWLNTQAAQLQQHGEAADSQLFQQQQQIQAASQQAMTDLQQKLLAQQGSVTNPGDSTSIGLDSAAQNQAAQAMIAAEMQRGVAAQASNKSAADMANASNYAMIAGAQAQAGSDFGARMRELGDAKVETKQERAGKIREEVVRRLDQEIAKAQSRVQMRESAAQIALGLKQHRLGKAQLALDEAIKNAQLDLEAQAQAETERANREAEEDRDRDRQVDDRNADADREDENQDQNQADRQEEHELNREIKHDVNNAVTTLVNSRKLQRIYEERGPQALVQFMIKEVGLDPLYANVAVDYVYGSAGLSRDARKDLRQIGYTGGFNFLPDHSS